MPTSSSRIPSTSPIEDFDLVTLDGRLLLVCVDTVSRVFSWDPGTGEWTAHPLDMPWRPEDEYDFTEVTSIGAVVVDGRIVVGGGAGHQGLAQWDLASGAVRVHARFHHGGIATVTSAELDGRPLLIGGDGSAFPAYLRVWDATRTDAESPKVEPAKTGAPETIEQKIENAWNAENADDTAPERFDGHGDGVGGIATGVLGGRDVLVSGGYDGRVFVWDIRSGLAVATFHETLAVRGAGLSTVDGKTMVVLGGDDAVMLGDPATGRCEEPIDYLEATGKEPDGDWEEGSDSITCLDTGILDGRPVAVTGATDGLVCVWDLTERRLLGEPFRGHERDDYSGVVSGVRFAELDGRTVVVSTGRDGRVHLREL